ncbi:hypothetical protein ABTY98_38690 [Streptomyces sp. NPDC096040]|uniref:hypothetical protein n=1 Tax=Streptomyces sp. NPDC096040 TaxID=3155541 RepID=UPI00332CF333
MLDPGSLPLPVDVASDPITFYVVYESGALGRIVAADGLTPVLAEGVRLVTQAAWEELQAEMREQHDARLAELHAEEEQTRSKQYADLMEVGLPEATARSLSGYTGQAVAADAQSAAQTAG